MKKGLMSGVLAVAFMQAAVGQEYLGQTKTYILSQFPSSRIISNKEQLLILKNGNQTACFYFTNTEGIVTCNIYGIEMPAEIKLEKLPALLKGYTFYSSGKILWGGLSCEGTPEYVDGTIYVLPEKYAITVYNANACGRYGARSAYVVFEYYHE